MAVINSVLGTMKGRIGNLSTRKTLSQNIIYARAAEVSNPRTTGQMRQRVKLGNVVILYRVLRRFLEAYAFENKDPKRSVYNEFTSLNLANSDVYLTKNAVKAGACVVAPYIISKGTLPMIGVTGFGASAATDIAVTASSFAGSTVGQFAADILTNNPRFKRGDQLSYVSITQVTGADGFPHVSCQIYEVILDPDSPLMLDQFFPSRAVAVKGGFLGHSSENITGAFAWVASRKDGGKVRVSTQALVLSSSNINAQFSNMSKAIASYGSTDTPFLDPDAVGTIGGDDVSGTIPSVASVKQGSTVLTRGMYSTQLTSGNIIVTGSNFDSSLTYTAKQNSTDLTVTRNSDTQLTITGVRATGTFDAWILTLKAGNYSFTLADSAAGGAEG